MKALDLYFPKLSLDVEFDPILTELWPWEGSKLKLGKYSKWIFPSKSSLEKISKSEIWRPLFWNKNLNLLSEPWFLAHSDDQGQFWKAKNLRNLVKLFLKTFFWFNGLKKAKNNKRILQKQIHFEYFPSLSFGPSQGHNSVNTGSNSTSRTIFEN